MTAATLVEHPRIPSIGTALLLHGFTRAPRHLAALSSQLTSAGVSTIRPALGSLFWPRSTNNSHHLTTVADGLLPDLDGVRVVVAGHSAGAAAGSWIAAELLDRGVDVRGLVLVDGVESPSRLIERAWPRLAGLTVRAVCAPPNRCNRDGRLAAWLSGRAGDVRCVMVDGSGHGDIEGTGSLVYRYGCGDRSGPQTRFEVLRLVVDAIRVELTAGP